MNEQDASQAKDHSYDLFVIHAPADAWFVHGTLLPALGLPAARVRIASELPLGQPALVELGCGIEASRCSVVVVSQAFITDVWSTRAELLASHAAVESARRVIPIYLDECEAPLHLAAAVSLDLRSRQRWEPELGRLRAMLQRPAVDEAPLPCPYPGMRPFRAGESQQFHGREREIDQIVQLLRAGERELYAVGPSGSGKSSLINAGVLPLVERAAERERLQLPAMVIRSFRPGAAPCARLAEALGLESAAGAAGAQGSLETALPAGSEAEVWAAAVEKLLVVAGGGAEQLLVFIDQLEELFALAGAEERGRFIRQLLILRADRRCRLLFGVRADFFGALIDSALWSDGRTLHVTVAPLRGEALRRAITRPALDAGVYFEPGLVERLLADADAEPGILPLLQETLVQLWARRQRRVLSLAAYEEMGQGGRHGLGVAIARHGDACLRGLSREEESWARRILLRLVAFGEGAADTRRQQRRHQLVGSEEPAVASSALEALAASRLITFDRAASDESLVDLAHESLLWAWPTLAAWVQARRKDEGQRRALVAKVAERQARREEDPTAGLLDALELREAEAWLGGELQRDLGEVAGLDELVRESQLEHSAIALQRKEARRLLGAMYLESGRQLLLEGHPQRAIPFLVAAREEHGASPALQMLFHGATRVTVAATMIHRGEVGAVAFSPDGGRLVTASDDGTARVWDAASGRPLSPPLLHRAPVKHAAFSADGARVVTASSDATARVWDAATGEAVTPPLRHTSSVWTAALSADGARVVTASLDRTARVWDAVTGEAVTPPLRHGDWVVSAAFSADGARVVTACHDGCARIWDAQSGALTAPPLTHDGAVEDAVFSPDGERVLTAGGKVARLWDAAGGEPLAVLRHGATVVIARFSPDGACVATGSADRTARLWSTASGVPRTPPLPHGAAVECLAFSPDGGALVTGSLDRTARVWEVATGKPAAAPLEHGRSVLDVAFSPDGDRLVTCSSDRAARVWELAARRARLPRFDHGRPVRGAAFSPDGARLVTVSRGQSALVWDVGSGAVVMRLKHERPVRGAAFSPDGTRLVTASWDQTARIWDAGSGALLSRLGHRGGVESAAFSADGARVVTAATDRKARIWDAGSGALLLTIGEHGGPVRAASFSPDGARIITACEDGLAQLWDAESGAAMGTPLSHGGPVLAASFSPDGRRLVTASGDGTARIWSAANGKPVVPPLLHGGEVYAAMFSDEGGRLVTASADKLARIWDAATGRLLATPMQHGGAVMSAAFSRDGMQVVTGSSDHAAQVWDAGRDRRPLYEWQEVAKRCHYLLAPELEETPAHAAPTVESGFRPITGGGGHHQGTPRLDEATGLPRPALARVATPPSPPAITPTPAPPSPPTPTPAPPSPATPTTSPPTPPTLTPAPPAPPTPPSIEPIYLAAKRPAAGALFRELLSSG